MRLTIASCPSAAPARAGRADRVPSQHATLADADADADARGGDVGGRRLAPEQLAASGRACRPAALGAAGRRAGRRHLMIAA
jgi:hypothetical protein